MVRPASNKTQHEAARAERADQVGTLPADRLLKRATADTLSCRLAAMVLLAGTLRPSPLQRATGRFVLDLPVEAGRTLLDLWHEQACQLVAYLPQERLSVRVLVDHHSPMPQRWTAWDDVAPLSVDRDPAPYRGTGGLLHDLAEEYADDDWLLVVDGAQLFLDPLWLMLHQLASSPGDVRMLAYRDGTPAGVKLVRCGCLRRLPAVGFVDFKEQALPRLAQEHDVRVARWSDDRRPEAMPGTGPGVSVRTLAGYLQAMSCWHSRAQAGEAGKAGAPDEALRQPARASWMMEPGYPVFSVVEEGAWVSGEAVLHDAVVLAGGYVEAGATVVRSVVAPGGCVREGQTRVNALVGPRAGPRSAWRESAGMTFEPGQE